MESTHELNATAIINRNSKCPRCQGCVFLEGDECWCLQCGYRFYTGRTLSLEQARQELRERGSDTT